MRLGLQEGPGEDNGAAAVARVDRVLRHRLGRFDDPLGGVNATALGLEVLLGQPGEAIRVFLDPALQVWMFLARAALQCGGELRHDGAQVADQRHIARAVLAERFRIEFDRSEEHTSELQSLMRISYAVFCLKNKNNTE